MQLIGGLSPTIRGLFVSLGENAFVAYPDCRVCRSVAFFGIVYCGQAVKDMPKVCIEDE